MFLFELISDIFANNYSTTPNASKYLDLISPSDYILRYDKLPDYPQKIYTFTLLNRSFNEITVYLTNGSSEVTVTVYDEINNLLEGAEISSALSGCFLKLDIEPELVKIPILSIVTPMQCFPTFWRGRLWEVLFLE